MPRITALRRLACFVTGFVLVLGVMAVLILASRAKAYSTAERVMGPWRGVSEHYDTQLKWDLWYGVSDAVTRLRLPGYGSQKGPFWLFFYDSRQVFDLAPITVQVDVFGRLQKVYARGGLWDNQLKRWLLVPGMTSRAGNEAHLGAADLSSGVGQQVPVSTNDK